jgi:O-acetyl-ADP-ribose deacetylase (regulator of RNase III)
MAAKIAIDAAISYLKDNSTSLKSVHFVVYDGNAYKNYADEMDKVTI